jgi:cathepsin B
LQEKAETAAEEGSQKHAEKPSASDLKINGDLSQLITAQPLRGARPGDGGVTVQKAAGHLFDNVMQSSGLQDELTDAEQGAFKDRFVATVLGKHGATKYWEPHYQQTAGHALESTKPVMTKAAADALNGEDLGFSVKMEDWMLHVSKEAYQARLGRTPLDTSKGKVADSMSEKFLPKSHATSRAVLPKSFDAREAWPQCAGVIGAIHNQGNCGSCWVFAALGSLDSRICIETNGSFSGDTAVLSRGYGASCVHGDGCQGGWEYYIFDWVEDHPGIPTTGCDPYFGGDDYAEHWTSSQPAPACPDKCDARYTRSMEDDMFDPRGMGDYQLVMKPDEAGIEQMKAAIYHGGTIPYGIYAEQAFMGYNGGIYSVCGGQSANHAVQAIGWGEGYILSQNSWGTDWGEEGRFRVAHCVPTDFTVPGDISAKDYPLPIPTATRTTTSTLPPPVDSTEPCVTLDDGCVTSPNFPNPYGSSQRCEISYKIGKLDVAKFDTEFGYDYLELNGEQFSGSHAPQGVVPRTNIVWSSDSSVAKSGWKICPTEE